MFTALPQKAENLFVINRKQKKNSQDNLQGKWDLFWIKLANPFNWNTTQKVWLCYYLICIMLLKVMICTISTIFWQHFMLNYTREFRVKKGTWQWICNRHCNSQYSKNVRFIKSFKRRYCTSSFEWTCLQNNIRKWHCSRKY